MHLRVEQLEVTVRVVDILEALRTNREAHIEMYEEAVEGYRERCEEELINRLEKVRDGKLTNLAFNLQPPKSHVKDFDRLIRMFEMTTEHEIALSEGQFKCYVENEWDWSRNWVLSNSSYSSTIAIEAANYSDQQLRLATLFA